MRQRDDAALGMDRAISRRDFLDGARIALTGSLAYGWFAPTALAAQSPPAPYPPALTGMRGTHDGAWEVAHAARDGKTWDNASTTDTEETYDLVVVGGGISGLAAAYFFRKAAGPGARILVLDNHDDFGGHAKRNEFSAAGRLLIGYGGRRRSSSVAHGARSREDCATSLASTRTSSSRLSIRRSMPGTGWGRASSSTARPGAKTVSCAAGAATRPRGRCHPTVGGATSRARRPSLTPRDVTSCGSTKSRWTISPGCPSRRSGGNCDPSATKTTC